MIHPTEILTDNTKIESYNRCKHCKFNDGGDNWSNKYNKDHCGIFAYPESKPDEVRLNGPCDFYVEDKNG